MSLEDDVRSVLAADSGAGKFATLIAGGIFTWESTGRRGLSHGNATTANAWNATTGILNPTCVVKARNQNYDGGPRDIGSVSYRQVVELWYYADGEADWDTIDAAQRRALALLDEQQVGATRLTLRWIGEFIRGRDEDLDRALMTRQDFDVRGQLG